MSDEQQQIPVPDHEQTPGTTCRWCGKPAVGEFEIEKPKCRKVGKVQVVAKRAITAPMCAKHRDNLLADKREARASRVREEQGWTPPRIV